MISIRWVLLAIALLLAGCAGDTRHRLVISVPDQKMLVLTDGKPVAVYPVSTSKFGTGDREGSYATPLGHLCIRKKIGDGAPLGTVFHSANRPERSFRRMLRDATRS